MLQIIGIMIGMYIVTRMLELVDERGVSNKKFGPIGVIAILTMLIAAGGVIYFILGPNSFPELSGLR